MKTAHIYSLISCLALGAVSLAAARADEMPAETYGPYLYGPYLEQAPSASASLEISIEDRIEVSTSESKEEGAEEFASSTMSSDDLDHTRGTEGVTAETLASITSTSMNNSFNVNMNGVSNQTLDSFNNFNGVANNIQVSGPGAQINTNTTINVYLQ